MRGTGEREPILIEKIGKREREIKENRIKREEGITDDDEERC